MPRRGRVARSLSALRIVPDTRPFNMPLLLRHGLVAPQRHLQALARARLSGSRTRDPLGAHWPVDAHPPRNALAMRDASTSTTGPPTGRRLSDVRALSDSC